MAFSGNYMCTSFKQELLEGAHNFKNSGGDVFKLAMYTNSASFNAATTAYTTSNEVSGSGYTAGGGTLVRVDPTTSGTTALTDFADLTFSNATVTARGALIYQQYNRQWIKHNRYSSCIGLLVLTRLLQQVILLFSSLQQMLLTLLSRIA